MSNQLRMIWRRPSDRHHQRGQSLVEVCVACIALVPLAIGLVYVGQYIHIRQVVQQAAREAAWDAAVAPSTYTKAGLDLATEQQRLRARYFGDAEQSLRSAEHAPKAFADGNLTDYSGLTLLDTKDFTLSSYKNEKTPGMEGSVDQTIGEITGALSDSFSQIGVNKTGSSFPPDPKGYITATTDAKTAMAKHFKPFAAMGLDFKGKTVLLADAWNADGGGEDPKTGRFDAYGAPVSDRTVRSQITYLSLGSAVFGGSIGNLVNKIVDFVGSMPVLDAIFPGFENHGLQLGRTAPDVVPHDKLKPYKE